MDVLRQQSSLIKAEARRLGFDGCGISQAACLEEDAGLLKSWLDSGCHGSMTYMANHADKRVDPRKLVEGAQSVVSVILNYFPGQKQHDAQAPVLSKYAYGADYHDVIRNKLKRLLHYISNCITAANGRAFTDSAPVLDRAWAARAGLGWIGKNTNLISPESGSFFFIGSLIVDIPLHYDSPVQDLCGDCNRCLQACPTKAIITPHLLDARRCISYLTIENRQEIDPEFRGQFAGRVFGCDICQDVCPWNRKAKPHGVEEFKPLPGVLEMTRQEWFGLDEERFSEIFQKSAVRRAKYEGMRRNLKFIEK
jgi:epoxyqueuosine reductase